jgi:hypothetical protein
VVRIHPGQLLAPIRRALPDGAPKWLERPLRFSSLGLLLLLLPFQPGIVQSASGAPAPSNRIPQDSIRLLRMAREAQQRFENLHRSRLVRAREIEGGRCDERVGRICLRWAGGMRWVSPPEDSLVAEARLELLRTLQGIAREIPGDHWVLSQRVRYLGDVGRWDEALTVASGCTGGEPWWCEALRGYVLHRSGQAHESIEAFQSALELMEDGEAAKWWDPSILLEYPAARWVRNPDGISAATALERFWRLADPLFLTPGNERLSEHFSRRFAASLYSDAAITLGLPWGESLEELLVRYGFTAGWERTWPEMGQSAGGSVVEHHHPESRGLLPPLEALEDPAGLPAGVWMADDDRPRSASAPVLAPLVVEGQGQTAVLRRTADLLVVAAYAPPRDTLLQQRRDPWEDEEGNGAPELPRTPWEITGAQASRDTLAGLFLMADTGAWAPLSTFSAGGEGVLQLRAPTGGYLLSLELWSPAGRWASRLRHGIRAEAVPPDVPTLSDLLLLRLGDPLPQNLAQALPRLKPRTDLMAGEPVTVGWEVYGLGLRREPLTFRLSLLEEEGSLVRRALKRIGLFNRAPAVTLSWDEPGSERVGPLFRAVDLMLPPLEPGRYVLTLEMDILNRGKVFSHRRITVY